MTLYDILLSRVRILEGKTTCYFPLAALTVISR